MSFALSQAERWLAVETTLGEDVLVASELKGVEGISTLFEFELHALSSRMTIKPGDLLGKSVTVSMARPGGERRLVNGIVTSFAGGAVTRNEHRLFRLTLSPSLWLLDRTSDYKVFQQKSAVDIAEEILGESKIAFQTKLQGSYEPREYCIQFGETDLAFLERLFAEEGIFYYFLHDEDAHTLVLADNSSSGYADCSQDEVIYAQGIENAFDAVYAFDAGVSLTDEKWVLRDYDFTAPNTPVEAERKTTLDPSSKIEGEHFRFPGGSVTADTLKQLTTGAIEASEARFEEVAGKSTCASFTPGHRFVVSEHPVSEIEGQRYTVTEVRHEAADRSQFTRRPDSNAAENESDTPFYRNSFRCIPAERTARRPLPPLKPLVYGPQTALVVGPEDQEIHTDEYGRIRIQFHWDRYGDKDEKSSCFVHVAQGLAGPGWGAVFIPRIGMEVVVHFLDGDPDRPLVTGAVYNGQNSPPWTLPTDANKSGLLTRSTLKGAAANANELSFDDTKDSEKVLFHAEKDFVREVENDDTLDVGHDQIRTIKNDRTTTITEGNETLTIKQGNRVEKIETGNETLDVDTGNRTVTIATGNETLNVKKGNRSTTLDMGNDLLTVKVGNQTTKADAGKITLEAVQGITLKCGSSTVELTQSGIKINGVTVAVNADAKAEVKSALVNVSGSATLALKGGIVKIN